MSKHPDQKVVEDVLAGTLKLLPSDTRWITIMMEVPWPKDSSKVYKTLLKVPETITARQLDLIEGKIYENTPPKKFRRQKR